MLIALTEVATDIFDRLVVLFVVSFKKHHLSNTLPAIDCQQGNTKKQYSDTTHLLDTWDPVKCNEQTRYVSESKVVTS